MFCRSNCNFTVFQKLIEDIDIVMWSQMFLHVCCATLAAPSEQFPAMLANTLVGNFIGQEVEPNFGSTEIGNVLVIVNVSIASIIVIYFMFLQDRK